MDGASRSFTLLKSFTFVAFVAYFGLTAALLLSSCRDGDPGAAVSREAGSEANGTVPGAGTASAPEAAPARGSKGPRCTFRRVHFMVEPDLVLEVERLVGELRPTGSEPATFDDPRSFGVWISEASVGIDTKSLAAMMNHHVFAADDAPMKNLEIATEGARLRISGTLHKGVPVPFTLLGDVSATPEGEVQIVPAELHAAGLPVRGLLDFFGVDLEDLMGTKGTMGVRVEENAIFLQPKAILPPPRLDGRIVAVEVQGDRLVERFGGRDPVPAVEPEAARNGNSMAFHGGVLRFGRLTMEPVDLTLVDADPTDPFLFSLSDYAHHLTAGYSLTLADGSLVTMMPDHDQTGAPLDRPSVPPSSPSTTPGRAAGRQS